MSGDGSASYEKLWAVLSAFRGVSQGISVEVLAVTLSKRPSDHAPQLNRRVTANIADTRERRHSKIIALVQTLADRVYHTGYILDDIELKDIAEEDRNSQNWQMKVVLNE